MFNSKLYIPRTAVINSVENLTSNTRLFKVQFKDDCRQNGCRENDYRPGQFAQVSVLGKGEVPISLCSTPTNRDYFELCIRNTGMVTSAISNFKKGDELGIRGPYGNGFPMEQLEKQDLLFIAGGIGLAPLRSVIDYVFNNRDDYGRLTLLYGAKCKEDIVFEEDLSRWSKGNNVKVLVTIDYPQQGWDGYVGVVTSLFDKIQHPAKYKALICGPPVMIHFVIMQLLALGLSGENIITTLERHMKCGVGKCGHCYLADKYVCTDGPVFTYTQLDVMKIPL